MNSINPAAIVTRISETMGVPADKVKDYYDELKPKHPIGRVGIVADTSSAIAFLAGDSASFLTGEILPVDGGYLL